MVPSGSAAAPRAQGPEAGWEVGSRGASCFPPGAGGSFGEAADTPLAPLCSAQPERDYVPRSSFGFTLRNPLRRLAIRSIEHSWFEVRRQPRGRCLCCNASPSPVRWRACHLHHTGSPPTPACGVCIRLSASPPQAIVLMIIMANSVTLALYDPLKGMGEGRNVVSCCSALCTRAGFSTSGRPSPHTRAASGDFEIRAVLHHHVRAGNVD